ncbi:serine hydrolase domain-containing protein [Streptomyces sp. NPDC048612]|uniref:serine hydrolase domain-containing protein n=1 Tax=Streptomyces sp. NPDC048612 TaxID=3365579 RepID=UPI0037173F10
MPQLSSAPVASRQPTEIRRFLQERLDTLARIHQVPGAQLALQLDSVTYAVHTGAADGVTGEPFTADTAVPLGSVTKPYTAAVVLLLADDGDLALTDLIGTHVPELRRAPHLTVRQLLSHTGGLPTGPDSDDAAALSAARYLSVHCSGRDAVCPPGSGFSYSNAGYVAAGRLIEAVTGMSWQDAVRALVLEPLGTDPAFLGEAAKRPVARGHSVHTALGRVRPVEQNLAPVEAPAGGLQASALDLVALGRALLGHGPHAVLTPDAAEEMRRPVPGAAPGVLADAWGLGLALFQQGAQQWCGHDGNAQGTSCHLRAEPDSGTVVAFTSNANNGTALWHELAEELAQICGVHIPAAARPAVEQSRTVALPHCAGAYHNGTVEYRVTADATGSLALTVNGDTPAPLVCYPDLSCDLVDPETGRRVPGGRFLRDPDSGAIDRLQISGRMARRTVTA